MLSRTARVPAAAVRVLVAFILALVMMISGAVSAQAAGTLSISGTVYLDYGPTTAPGVRVEWTLVGETHNPANVVTTDSSGNYTITGLDGGSYYLYFDYTGTGGYLDQWFASTSPQTPWTTNPVDGADAVNLLWNNNATQINVGLKRVGSISGVVSLGTVAVTAAAGEVLVSYRCLTKKATGFGAWSAPVPTASDGSYLIDNVQPSPICQVFFDYQGTTYSDQYGGAFADFEHLARNFQVFGETPGVDSLLPVARIITGRVSLGTAGVAAGAGEVSVSAGGATTTTDAAGDYQLTVPPSTSRITFTYVGTGDFIETTNDYVPGDIKNITIANGVSISGHVYLDSTATSATAGEVRVVLQDFASTAVKSVLTDANGNYRLAGLFPSVYSLKFEYVGPGDYPVWYLGQDGESAGHPFNLLRAFSTLTGKDVTMGTGAAIAGTVTDSSGAPIAGQVVYAFDANHYSSPNFTLQTTTLADGSYRFRSIGTGVDYAIEFEGSEDYAPEAWDDQSVYYYGDTVSIPQGDRSLHGGVDAELEHPATISGVIGVSGAAPPGFDITRDLVAEVLVRDGATNTWVETGDFYDLDSTGAYAITGLKPDSYRVAVFYLGDGAFSEIRSPVLNATEGAGLVYSSTIPLRPKTIAEFYSSVGGPSGPLGAPVSGIGTYPDAGGGSLQHFTNGTIYASKLYGTHVVWAGPIRETYWAARSILGNYGWPVGDQDCVTGTCTQLFMGGPITPTYLNVVQPPVVTGHNVAGATLTVSTGTYSPAATSYTYAWRRNGTYIPGATSATYTPKASDIGTAISADVIAVRSGSLTTTANSETTAPIGVSAATQIATLNAALPGQLGAATTGIGSYPNAGGGSLQHFTNGSIYSSNSGTWVVWAGPIRDTYWGARSILGTYGWPTGAQDCSGGPCVQTFTGGSITASPLEVNTAPTVTGPAQVGATLVANPGSYSPAGASFRFAWLRNGALIAGATSSSFALTATDLGKTLQVRVTASRTGSVSTVTLSVPTAAVAPSAAMQIAALNASLPGQLGAATSGIGTYPNGGGGSLQHFTNGSIYSSNSGTWVVWAGPIRDTYWGARSILGTYGWPTGAQDCSDGPCVQTFVGGSITASPLGVTAAPTVTGPAQVGVALVANPGTYDPAGASFRYAWVRPDGTRIAGATSASYIPVAADAGLTLRVEVTASKVGSVSVTTLSAPTAAVAPSAAMQIAALNASLGGQLGAATSGIGTYPNAGGGSLQHFTNGSIYSSTTSGTWVVWAGPIRDAYWAARSILGTYGWPTGAQDCSGGPCVQTFMGDSITAAPLQVTAAPTLTGPAQVGATLVANPGTYNPAATSFRYAWLRPNGTRIAGATSASYVPVAADAGLTLRVEVTASKVGSVSVTTLSAPTAAIGPSGASLIATMYASLGGSAGVLGPATSPAVAFPDNGGGTIQHFTGGSIYSSAMSGTWVVRAGPIRDAYWAARSILGTYQWPTGDRTCVGTVCTQTFMGGTITR